MIFFLFSVFSLNVNAQTPEVKAPPIESSVVPAAPPAAPTAAVPTESSAPATKESDYEVDYEEEPGTEEVEEPAEEKPVKTKQKKIKGKKNTKESVSQGSRAEKKIAPMMKSETKSIYQKNGKPLDVDSD